MELTKEEIQMALADFLSAQKEMRIAEMNAENEFAKYKYANLEAVINAIKGPLNNNGYFFTHSFKMVDGKEFMITEFIHKTGFKISSEKLLDLPAMDWNKKNYTQCMGALMTYYRRYCLSNLAGITQGVDFDEDAEKINPRWLEAEQVNEIKGLIKDDGKLLKDILAMTKVKDLKNILKKDYDSVLEFLNKRLSSKKPESLPKIDDQELQFILRKIGTKKELETQILKHCKIKSLEELTKKQFEGAITWIQEKDIQVSS